MFEKFEALNEEKKKNILNAAMTEFVRGGYEKASMNALVEAAGISKGSLFYYFKNKKTLYLYLFEYCEGLIIKNAHRHIDQMEPDFLSRMEHVMRCNISLLEEFPLVYAFVRSCKSEKSNTVAEDIQAIKAKRTEELYSEVYKDIDESLFREGLDLNIAVYAIKATLFQISHDAMRQSAPEKEVTLAKIRDTVQFFRQTFYK